MRVRFLRAVFVCAVSLWLTGVAMEARGGRGGAWSGADAVALHEMLEGTSGRREAWSLIPELVILTSVMEFSGPDMSAGYVATGETLTAAEVATLESDLTAALGALTGGRFPAFSAVRTEAVAAGQLVPMFRRGQVVVGQFQGVRAKSGNLGLGGRTARAGAISAGAVVLDREFDRRPDGRQMLRTHELGHALGYNHVESRRSVMNPRVGTDLTDFDRNAIEVAFLAAPNARTSQDQARLQN